MGVLYVGIATIHPMWAMMSGLRFFLLFGLVLLCHLLKLMLRLKLELWLIDAETWMRIKLGARHVGWPNPAGKAGLGVRQRGWMEGGRLMRQTRL